MSLTPVFKIGLWNAWIFILLIFFPLPLVALFRKSVFKKSDSIPVSFYTRTEYKILIFSKVIMFSVFIYSIFLPLQLGTIWFSVATSPVDKPITKGLYRYSRHPIYVNLPLIFIGTSIASASWLFLLLSIILIITHLYNGIAEERVCLKAYGDAYREYMNRTSRWIGIPKSEKK
jgi:protein-S-isoprenylcysteine O-methyltransferase Ste14